MEWRERRVAQIVRDFMEAYVLSAEIGAHLRAGDLDFAWVSRLVGESEESALYRLKEETHALFRFDVESSESELQAEELFDLAVGALFHEAMKFREGFYLTTSYGPRLDRIVEVGTPSRPLVKAFRRVFKAGRRRMLEAQVETQELFRETRDQLLILLRQLPESGAVSRSLVEDPARTGTVFGVELDTLLAQLYGSNDKGYRLAIENLLEGGHYQEAAELLELCGPRADAFYAAADLFARGMERYYSGDLAAALGLLSDWIGVEAGGPPLWHERARRVLNVIVDPTRASTPPIEARARKLMTALRPERPS